MVRRIINAIYNFVTAILNTLGFRAPRPWGWTWRVVDQVGDPDDSIDELFRRFMRDEGIKAGQFALHVNGMLAVSAAYTWAEPEYRTTTTTSLMRIASCSKAFTTAAVLPLIAMGTLDADEPVFAYLGITENDPAVSSDPEPADPRVRDITIGHLVEHTAGWDYRSTPLNAPRDWVFRLKDIGRGMGLSRPPGKEEFARFMFNVTLDTAPGATVQYSNIGYLLLGMVIEKAMEMPYITYLETAVLPPLGITDVFVGGTRLADRRSNEVVYEDPFVGPDATLDPFSPRTAPLPYGGFGGMTEVMDSGGGLITSAVSLSRFITANNAYVNRVTDTPGRALARRDGGMPGTTAVAKSFDAKDGSRRYDMAFLFNQRDKSLKDGVIHSPRLDSFVDALEARIQEIL